MEKYVNIQMKSDNCNIDIDKLKIIKKVSSADLLIYSNDLIYHPSDYSINYLNNIYPKIVDTTVLDLCSGSGIVGLGLSKTNKLVDCADISIDSINVININKQVNDCINVTTIQSDMFNNIDKLYDVIVGVPPMLSTQQYEERCNLLPRQAYDAGQNQFNCFKQIIEQGKKHLFKNGRIFLPVSTDMHKEKITELLQQNSWNYNYYDCDNLIEQYQYPQGYMELVYD